MNEVNKSIIDKLKASSEPALLGHVCGNCRHFRESGMLSRCAAVGGRLSDLAWSWDLASGGCQRGALWEAWPPHVPMWTRIKRWWIG
jgi:hypothetical protein